MHKVTWGGYFTGRLITMKIVLKLTDSKAYNLFMRSEEGVYTVKLSKNFRYWYYALCDMIGFYQNTDINLVIDADSKDVEKAKKLYGNHRYNDRFLRTYENKVICHSATKENLKNILKDGKLKSWNILNRENIHWEKKPIGSLLGDIKDFSDYIMFSFYSQNNEIITASKQKNEIDIDENQVYTAGGRLYFDAEKIAEDGLLLRDGEHIKVKDTLSLDKYMIWYATPERIGINEITTPKEFFECSNKKFMELFY